MWKEGKSCSANGQHQKTSFNESFLLCLLKCVCMDYWSNQVKLGFENLLMLLEFTVSSLLESLKSVGKLRKEETGFAKTMISSMKQGGKKEMINLMLDKMIRSFKLQFCPSKSQMLLQHRNLWFKVIITYILPNNQASSPKPS